jgi:hypothetical protein
LSPGPEEQGLHGFRGAQGFRAAQGFRGVHGFGAAQGFRAAHGPQVRFAAQGLVAAHGWHGLRAAQGLPATRRGTTQRVVTNTAAHGLTARQGFVALHGLRAAQGLPGSLGAQGPHGCLAAQGLARHGLPAVWTAFAGDRWPRSAVWALDEITAPSTNDNAVVDNSPDITRFMARFPLAKSFSPSSPSQPRSRSMCCK